MSATPHTDLSARVKAAREALDDAVRQGRLRPGDVIVLCGSGGGVAMGCLAFRWTK